MAIQIQFRRGTAAEWESVNPILAEGEMGIETDTNLFKIGNGINQWNDLEYGGLRGFSGSVGFAGSVGNMSVANVLYVSKSGNDLNSGTAINLSKLTIKSALQVATNGTTIFVKSGDYTEDNPLYVPEGVAIVGDNLRTSFVRPANVTDDIFWVNNGVYLANMTFKDHERPSSAVAFPPDGSAGAIHTSPYVQNCSSITTTGSGMRVDGNHAKGTKSMVADAYTQYNQGGIGIHHLNRGNSQLVSIFTICCDIGFLSESGGFCSITNSNSSFGNFALKSTGVSLPLYSGKLKGTGSGFVFEIDNLINRPNVGDAVKFEGDPNYYTLSSATAITSGNVAIQKANFTLATPDGRNIRANILDQKDKIQTETIDFLNETYPSFDFNQFKCSRDVGIIIDSVTEDMLFGTNYRTRLAGISYFRASASKVLGEQLPETVASVNFVKNKVLTLIENDSTQGPEYEAIRQNFDTVIAIMSDNDGIALAPALIYPALDSIDPNRIKAKDILQANRQYIMEEGIAYISDTFPLLGYNRDTCERDIGLILDAVGYDLMFGSNFRSITAGRAYYREGAAVVTASQKEATIDSFNYLKTLIRNTLTDDSTVENVAAAKVDIIIGFLEGVGFTGSQGSGSTFVNLLGTVATINDLPIPAQAQTFVFQNPGFAYTVTGFTGNNPAITVVRGTTYTFDFAEVTGDHPIALRLASGNTSAVPGTTGNDPSNGVYGAGAIVTYVVPVDAPASIRYQCVNHSGMIGTINAVNSSAANNIGDGYNVQATGELWVWSGTAWNNAGQGLAAVEPAKVIPAPPGYDAGFENARNLIEANRTFIKEETIQYIKNNFPEIGYDRQAFEHEVGLIVDAISYDVMFGSNFRTITAAKSYYRESVAVVPSSQKTATIGALAFLKQELLDLVTGDITAQVSVTANMDTIISVLENGLGSVPSSITPVPTNYDQGFQYARNLIESNRGFVKAEVMAFIGTNYPNLSYDPAVRQRDIDLILDALFYDLTYGGNLETITAGRAYYSTGVVQMPSGEKAAILDAYAFMRDLIGDVSQNIDVTQLQNVEAQAEGDAGSSQAATTAENLIDLIRTIIDTEALGTEVAPNTSWVSQPRVNAFNTIQVQRSTLQDDAGDHVDENYFYMTKCKRDIDFILDAMYYDLTYGGNMETLIAARAYYSYNFLQIPIAEKAATLAAYDFMRDLIGDVAQNTDVTELQAVTTQTTGLAGSAQAATAAETLVQEIRTTIDTGTAPAEVLASTSWVAQNLVTNHQVLQSAKSTIQSSVTVYIEENWAYNRDTCARDIGLIVDAVCYDLMYGGNGQTADAADEYFSGGVLQIPADQREATALTFDYIRSIADDVVLNTAIPSLNDQIAQIISLPAATSAEVSIVDGLFGIVSGLVRDAYTSTMLLEENVIGPIPDNTAVTFHQFSLITASGHTFEWVGAGINVNSALPYLGGIPLSDNLVIEENSGKVYFTGTDQQGDFRIGNDFVINRNTGTVTGRTFTKSLFAVITPYILAIGA